ncbi:hypothetical protein [Candidatus Nitrotoga arctica]|uniref:Uncharacterized protein n=1 Tax=Candidatus Nitrotoga arctica TaxID=453162 RepID=A0ABM8YXI8_9PROT|nr:hypothetical protein [Candidatus Nitrotoga arctica]CAG9932211.1 conserved protein of unknown function [Candidatus Nitrotoga arctica]
MLSQAQLQKNLEISNACVRKMDQAVAALNAVIETAEKDKSRSRDWVLSTVKAAREKALPAITAELKTIMTMADTSSAHQRFWENRPLLLSLQKFDEDDAKDAQIRIYHAAELASSSLPLLGLMLENARSDKNLALIYQCWRVGQGRSSEAGFVDSVDLALDGIEIPGQAISLSAIATCISNRSYAEMIWSAAGSGRSADPVRRLTVARQQEVSSRIVSPASAL